MEQNPTRATEVFNKIQLVLYGSFNLRCLRKEGPDGSFQYDYNWLHSSTSPFLTVTVYESFTGISKSTDATVSATALPELFARLEAPEFADTMNVCKIWDQYIVDDCDATCAECEDGKAAGDAEATARWERNDHCRNRIRACLGKQFVPADFVLACVWNTPEFYEFKKPVAYAFDKNPYPNVSVCPDLPPGKFHKVWAFLDMPWDLIQKFLFSYLEVV